MPLTNNETLRRDMAKENDAASPLSRSAKSAAAGLVRFRFSDSFKQRLFFRMHVVVLGLHRFYACSAFDDEVYVLQCVFATILLYFV